MSQGIAEAVPCRSSSPAPCAPRLPVWTSYAIALLFALLGLRGLGNGNIIDTDAARHAMNGAFIHDLIANGRVADPVGYGKEYYGHLPALSMPYHPPMFPAIEALFYFVFGVNLLAARLAVAVAVGVCAVLLYKLVQATHGSDWLALAVTVTLLSLEKSQLVATDVMLEYPAMAFCLAAVYCVRHIEKGYPLWRALLFAFWAAAAIWTKQFAVFLVAVPPLYLLLTGRWRRLFSIPLWVSSGLLGASVIALVSLSMPFHHAGINQVAATPDDMWWVITHNIVYYGEAIGGTLFGIAGLFALAAAGLLIWQIRRTGSSGWNLGLYGAWIVALGVVLLFVGARSGRYLFFMFPPVLAVGYTILHRGCAMFWGEARAWRVPAAFAVAWLVAGLVWHPEFLRGPAQAAEAVMAASPSRVLYGGDADGNFIFEVRARDSRMATTVIPAGKLPDDVFSAAAFEDFCRRYDIGWVVFEETATTKRWNGLLAAPAPSMKLERILPLESSRPRWRGRMRIYRFTSASGHPEGGLELPVGPIGSSVQVSQ